MFIPTRMYKLPIQSEPQYVFHPARSEEIQRFWEDNGHGGSNGIYFLGLRSRQGWLRIRYVGKAIRQSFASEAYSTDKLARHYTPMLREANVIETLRNGGRLVMGFIVYQLDATAKVGMERITALEKELIQLCTIQYGAFLSNVQNRLARDFVVPGLTYFGGEKYGGAQGGFFNAWADLLGVSNAEHSPSGVRWPSDHTE